jgi:cyclic-di-GMP-binding protein
MNTATALSLTPATEASIKGILEWLAKAHDRQGSDDADQLYRQLIKLRDTPLPISQRIKLLDLLHGHAERIVMAELPGLQQVSLPVSRKIRHRVKAVIDLLETLTQDYFNSLAELFDPTSKSALRAPHTSLLRALQGIAWQIRINHMLASPTRIGLWQLLHTAFRTARRLGLENFPGPRGGAGVQRAYTDILLAAIAQPASFSAAELDFITTFIDRSPIRIELQETLPADTEAVFWIDLDSDFPAHALIRRTPAAETSPLYFSCAAIAANARRIHAELALGLTPEALGLPAFAGTRAGRGVLLRLAKLWGKPTKRRFTRRRQSYRANLCLGLNNLWKLLRNSDAPKGLSEWMVTNESPDGYSLMHVIGSTYDLRIGEVVALRAIGESESGSAPWHICIIRWAISENPEHVEIGLQMIAAHALAAKIAQPFELSGRHVNALILPRTPPLRPLDSLLVASGNIHDNQEKLVLLVEMDNLLIREVRTEQLDEQTSSLELFSLAPGDSV